MRGPWIGGSGLKLDVVTVEFLPDPTTPFGERVRLRLRDEQLAWLTTVGADGTPQPNPIWFLWDGETFLVYNRATAHRLAHVRARPRVALHFDSNGRGGNIVVITGDAEIVEDVPPPHLLTAYLDKYGTAMKRVSGSLEGFSQSYPVPMRIRPSGLRGW